MVEATRLAGLQARFKKTPPGAIGLWVLPSGLSSVTRTSPDLSDRRAQDKHVSGLHTTAQDVGLRVGKGSGSHLRQPIPSPR